jgi:hypothetical protein
MSTTPIEAARICRKRRNGRIINYGMVKLSRAKAEAMLFPLAAG